MSNQKVKEYLDRIVAEESANENRDVVILLLAKNAIAEIDKPTAGDTLAVAKRFLGSDVPSMILCAAAEDIQQYAEEYAANLCEACKAPCEWERTNECAADHVLYKTSCGHKLIRQRDDVCPQCGHKIVMVFKGENK